MTNVQNMSGFRLHLAKYMNVSPSCIYEWLNPTVGKNIPWKRCIQIERLSKGRVRVEDLRSDLFEGINTDRPNPFLGFAFAQVRTKGEIQGVLE